jgi:hypothetical protein
MDHLRQFYALTQNNSFINKVRKTRAILIMFLLLIFVLQKQFISVKDANQKPFQRLNDVQIPTNDTVTRMNSIFERLRYYDRSLHCKLEELNIEPTVYGM